MGVTIHPTPGAASDIHPKCDDVLLVSPRPPTIGELKNGSFGAAEEAAAQAIFSEFSKGTEFLDTRHLADAIKASGHPCTRPQAIALLQEYDSSGDGRIDLSEVFAGRSGATL